MKKRKECQCANIMAQDALYMHRTYEERYWTLMMVWTDNNYKIERLVNEAEKKSEYWKKKYEKLLAKEM